jgi:CheY-like chemotaxis protein
MALADALLRTLSSKATAPLPVRPELLRQFGLVPRNMLLVGDDAPRQPSALELLARWEVSVAIATNCADAVQFASDSPFDLILVDASKSVLDCVFVSSRLRNLERSRRDRSPVALVARVTSNWPAAEKVLRMVGVNDVLKMESEPAAVGECLRRWCIGHYQSKAAEVSAGAFTFTGAADQAP